MPITEIPRRRNFDGQTKHYTKDCDGCPFYRKIDELEICGWGVRFKYVKAWGNMRKCEFRGKPASPYASFHYLDGLDLDKLRQVQEQAAARLLSQKPDPVQTSLLDYIRIF